MRQKKEPSSMARACIVAGFLALAVSAQGRDYPSQTIHFLVAFGAGGAYDIMARVVAKDLSDRLSVPIVVENRPGAGGNIGAAMAAKLAPDGYNIFVCNISNAISPSLYRDLAYDPLRDFDPITLAVKFAYILGVHPSLPVKSVHDLIELARRRPDQIAYGSAGFTTQPFLAVQMMSVMTGIKMIHVPYGGNPEAQRDLFAGQIQALFLNTPNALNLMRAGRVRGLAISSPQRSKLAPDLPTMIEAGLPGFDISAWAGFCAPAHTPVTVITKLDSEIRGSLNSPEVRSKFVAQGFEIPALPPAEFRAYFKSEMDKYAKLIREAKIKVQ